MLGFSFYFRKEKSSTLRESPVRAEVEHVFRGQGIVSFQKT